MYLPRDHSTQKNRGFAFVRFYEAWLASRSPRASFGVGVGTVQDRRDAEMCVQAREAAAEFV